MRANIIRIGNSKGIRLPKAILEQCQLEDVVEIEVERNALIIRRIHAPRANWSQAFADMAKNKDDTLLDSDAPSATEWDRGEWRW
jgi:antitoxin MazE